MKNIFLLAVLAFAGLPAQAVVVPGEKSARVDVETIKVGSIFGIGSPTEAELRRIAAESNVTAQLPKMLDEWTRIEEVTAGPGVRFNYNYTLVKQDFEDIDANVVTEVVTKIRSQACVSKNILTSLKRGVTVTYSYKSRDGKPVLHLEVTRATCGI